MLAPLDLKIRKLRSKKKLLFLCGNFKEPKGAHEYSIFTKAPLAPFWLLRLLIIRRPPRKAPKKTFLLPH